MSTRRRVENGAVAAFLDRRPRREVPARATVPKTIREATEEERRRGVAVAYATANFTVYRAIVDRLAPGERLRMETQFGVYEFSAADFYEAFPGIAASASFTTGAPSMLDKAYYVVGPPPAAGEAFRVEPR